MISLPKAAERLWMQKKELKTRTVKVASKSGDKSIKVAMESRVKHPKYGKIVTTKTTFMVHDEHNQAGVGDVVQVAESRPYSKNKSWRLVSVIEKKTASE